MRRWPALGVAHAIHADTGTRGAERHVGNTRGAHRHPEGVGRRRRVRASIRPVVHCIATARGHQHQHQHALRHAPRVTLAGPLVKRHALAARRMTGWTSRKTRDPDGAVSEPNPSRISGSHLVQGDSPSGRHDPAALGLGARSSRQTETDLALTALMGRVARLEEQMSELRADNREQGARLTGLNTEFAVALSDLRAIKDSMTTMEKDIEDSIRRIETKIESSLARLEAQRERTGDRTRDILRTGLQILTAIAAIVGLVVGLAR